MPASNQPPLSFHNLSKALMSCTDPGPAKSFLSWSWCFFLCMTPVWKQLTSSLTAKRKSPSCSREDASCLNKHIDRWRAGSPRELWSPLPPPLCRTGLMGVRGEAGGPREETDPFIPALLPDHGTQQNKTGLSCGSAPAPGHPETPQNKQRYSSQVNYQHRSLLWSPGPSCCEWGR